MSRPRKIGSLVNIKWNTEVEPMVILPQNTAAILAARLFAAASRDVSPRYSDLWRRAARWVAGDGGQTALPHLETPRLLLRPRTMADYDVCLMMRSG